MQELNRESVRVLRTKIDAALATVGKEMGLSLKAGNCYFTGTTATFKLEVATIAADGKVVNKMAEEFRRYAPLYHLKPDDLGREFTIPFTTAKYVVEGIKPSSRKYPIICKKLYDGKMYKMTARQVVGALYGAKAVSEVF